MENSYQKWGRVESCCGVNLRKEYLSEINITSKCCHINEEYRNGMSSVPSDKVCDEGREVMS